MNHDDHYIRMRIQPVDVQEQILAQPSEVEHVARHHIAVAVAYQMRAGMKEGQDWRKDLEKAENYLHRARTGLWINDDPVCSPVLTAEDLAQNEEPTVKESLQVPEIPAGWIVWDRVIPWEKVAKRAQMWDGSSWFEMRLSDAPPPAWRIIIPGQDAGEALVGVECWVKYDDDEPWQGPIVVDGIDPKAKRRKYDHRSIRHADGDGSFWGSVHARPTYLGRPE